MEDIDDEEEDKEYFGKVIRINILSIILIIFFIFWKVVKNAQSKILTIFAKISLLKINIILEAYID